MNIFTQNYSSRNLWNISGSFGEFLADVSADKNKFSADNGIIRVVSHIERDQKSGVSIRYGKAKNISDKSVILNSLSSRFCTDGGEYEVYTQYNSWQNESMGGWQNLVTSVSARCKSVRNAFNAAPFMVLWSNQTSRGTAFHLNAYGAWEMRISRLYAGGEATYIEAEFGLNSEGLALKLEPGEEIEIPEIIYYDVQNKTDLDCWKLHTYLNCKYPRRKMPVIYNSWLYKFDRFCFDDIQNQIDRAKDLRVEYFVIDAGWFGDGENWSPSRGDWSENQKSGFCGKMSLIANAVREAGMKFGFWLEPECASLFARTPQKYPSYFIKGNDSYFIDFSNNEAFEYIFDKTCELIDCYGAEFVKFDFNADLEYDKNNSAFTAYFDGHMRFIRSLKEKYPDLYVENCASGGMRMTVRDGMAYDSFWLSDNQSPYIGIDIFKNTLLRMPPQWIECWLTVTSAKAVAPIYGKNEYSDKLIACNDAKWDSVVGVHQSFLNGFLTGSPIGLSFDLTSLTDEAFDALRTFITQFKEKRRFWQNAVCHILTDTETMLVLEFRNFDFSQVELVVFAKKALQNNICVYPIVNPKFSYKVSHSVKASYEIAENGIDFAIDRSYTAQFMTIVAERNQHE